jgi:hypothetical protein
VRVPIIEATADDCPDLRSDEAGGLNDGSFSQEQLTVFVRAGMSKTQRRDAIAHELAHAFLYLSGIGALLSGVVRWKKGAHDFEETLVRLAAPHLGRLIK